MRSIIFVLFFFVTKVMFAAEPLTEADIAFVNRNYATALEIYSQVREQTQKDVWKQITVKIIRCCTAQGETERAVQEYFLLCRVDPTPPLDCIPLPWFVPIGTVGTKLSEKTAVDWLDPLQTKSSCLAAKLLAAATLSVATDNGKQQRGYQLLRDLESTLGNSETQESREIALLAAALRWKQRMLTFRNPTELTPFRRILDQMPDSLQAGPFFLFGQAAQRVGDHETAVLAWMRIPILYPENRPLANEALRKAAESLDKLGRSDQAEQLRLEAENAPK